MKTENFSLGSATAVQIFATRVRVIRYDEGAGTGTPTIRVRSLNTGELDVEMKPGRQIIMPQAVDGIIITNLTANPITGKLTIGAGDVSDNSLVGTVTLDAPTLAALEYVSVRPEASTGAYASQTLLGANGSDPVFLAGANLNGAIILSAGYVASSPSAPILQTLLANAATPANPADGEVILSGSFDQLGSTNFESGQLNQKVFVPAGLGLYFCSAAAQSVSWNLRHCRYRLL